MIFDELVLEDVGPFAGVQHLPLAPRANDQPVILVGGLNGSGKTTVLEALLLVLYGGLTPGTARRASSYERYLRQLINHSADPGRGASVELAYRAVHDGAWHSFRVRRHWWLAAERVRESVHVTRDGAPDPVLTEAWSDHVETLAPRGVANLFFFDGEQIEAFADLEVARELISTAIGRLLGLDLVDRLQDDLTVLERRKRSDALEGEEEQRAIKLQQSALDAVRRAEGDARQAVDEAERVVTQAQAEADDAARRLAREGGERYQAREELQRRHQEAQTRLRQCQAALTEALGGLSPLFLVESLIGETITQAAAEQRQADDLTLADLLTERDASLQALLRKNRATTRIQQVVADFLNEDLARRKAGDGTPTVVGVAPSTLALGRRLLAGELSAERAHLRQRLDELQAAHTAMDDADRALEAVPAAEAIADVLEAHQQATYTLAEARARLDAALRAHQESTTRRHSAERNVERELLKANAALLESEDAKRVVEHAGRARATLARLRATATQRHSRRIESLILDSVQTLIRKRKLISEVKIDPDTSKLELLSHDGRPVRPRTLSAGERQLLAVSLLAGLAKASGRLLPVLIDTPLGRLDQDHREKLIQRYLPHASHQVIVLSTDTEITPEVSRQLGEAVSHTIRLDHQPGRGSAIVTDGYFDANGQDEPSHELVQKGSR